jgi:hypothetical protein
MKIETTNNKFFLEKNNKIDAITKKVIPKISVIFHISSNVNCIYSTSGPYPIEAGQVIFSFTNL